MYCTFSFAKYRLPNEKYCSSPKFLSKIYVIDRFCISYYINKICLLGFTSRMCEKFYDVDIEKILNGNIVSHVKINVLISI